MGRKAEYYQRGTALFCAGRYAEDLELFDRPPRQRSTGSFGLHRQPSRSFQRNEKSASCQVSTGFGISYGDDRIIQKYPFFHDTGIYGDYVVWILSRTNFFPKIFSNAFLSASTPQISSWQSPRATTSRVTTSRSTFENRTC
jgi:hypothetical protein